MNNKRKLVFATNNPHKLEEARSIVSDRFEIVSLSDIGCHDDIPETAETLAGNALIKARWVKERYGFDCFADDTGLMVDALGGAPGVYSARYAGEHCSPADNVRKLLGELEGVENRDAHFSTVIALISDGEEHLFEGTVEGNIAHHPHGSGGFGYDPVFVAKETGKCFAEMSAADKNAISHRGRAMRKLVQFLGAFIVMVLSVAAPAMAAQWRVHASFDGQMMRIADTPKFVYMLGTKQEYNPANRNATVLHGILFRYDKDSEETTFLNSQNVLASNTVKTIAYNYDKNFLAVALDDGVVQLLYDNGDVKTIRGLMAADASLDKTINDFTFDNASGKIYAATNFGYVSFDESLGEVETSRIFDVKVNSAAIFDGKLWLGTSQGIYSGNPNSFNLSEFDQIMPTSNVQMLSPVGSDLYYIIGIGNNVTCSKIGYENGKPVNVPVSYASERTFQRGRDAVMTVSNNRIRWIDNLGKYTYYDLPEDYYQSVAGSIDGREFWMSTGRKGISCLRAPGDDGRWSVTHDRFFPNASSAFQCASMAYHPEYGMLVRNHGYEGAFSAAIITTNDLISGYKDMNWSRLSTTYRTDMPGLLIESPFGLAVDPNNTDHVYCGSERTGFLRLDLRNPERSIHFSKKTDWLGGFGYPGFAVVVPDNPEGTWEQQCVFAPPVFDSAGNLWTAYVNPEKGYEASSYTELWVWPPSARAATTDATNVNGWVKIKIDDLVSGNTPVILPLRHSSNRNLVLHSGNNLTAPMLVLDHNGTIDNTTDDRHVRMKTLHDQDGNDVSFPRAVAMHEDQTTGLVWISTGLGLFTFNPSEAFTDPYSVRRVKVPRNDGTNLADYLLENVTVNCIYSDPSGRKWFGTTGAGLVCTSSDGRQILETYTRENSEIAGDNVFAVCYNPASQSMMVSTDNGLCELFLSGSGSGQQSDVRAYPNPVRPDYFGYVTIDGLAADCMVKIVDTAGNLVKECGEAYNGSVQWDVTNNYLKRVPAGVYFIIASSGPDGESFDKVGKILVVN